MKRLIEMWDTKKCNNIQQYIGYWEVLEREERGETEIIFKEVMAKIFPNPIYTQMYQSKNDEDKRKS